MLRRVLFLRAAIGLCALLAGCNRGTYFGEGSAQVSIHPYGGGTMVEGAYVFAPGRDVVIPLIVSGKSSSPLTVGLCRLTPYEAAAALKVGGWYGVESTVCEKKAYVVQTSSMHWVNTHGMDVVYADCGALAPGVYGAVAQFGDDAAGTVVSVSHFGLFVGGSGTEVAAVAIDASTHLPYRSPVDITIYAANDAAMPSPVAAFSVTNGVGATQIIANKRPCCPIVVAKDRYGPSAVLEMPELWYGELVRRDPIFIETDRSYYRPGDTVQYRIVVAPFARAWLTRGNAVDLACGDTNVAGIPVVARSTPVTSPFGTLLGSLPIPASLEPGYCRLDVGTLPGRIIAIVGHGAHTFGVSVIPQTMYVGAHIEPGSVPGPIGATGCGAKRYVAELEPARWWVSTGSQTEARVNVTALGDEPVRNVAVTLTVKGVRWHAVFGYIPFWTETLHARTGSTGSATFFWRPAQDGVYRLFATAQGETASSGAELLVVGPRVDRWFGDPALIPRVVPDRYDVSPGALVRLLVLAPRPNEQGAIYGNDGGLVASFRPNGLATVIRIHATRDATAFSAWAAFGRHDGLVAQGTSLRVDPVPRALVVDVDEKRSGSAIHVHVGDAFGASAQAELSVSADDAAQSRVISDPFFNGTARDYESAFPGEDRAGSFLNVDLPLWVVGDGARRQATWTRGDTYPTNPGYCSAWDYRAVGDWHYPALLQPRLADVPSGAVTQALWIPQLVTDRNGNADIPLTKPGIWRVRVLAVSRDGRIGLDETQIVVGHH
jgi:hypothetical protein